MRELATRILKEISWIEGVPLYLNIITLHNVIEVVQQDMEKLDLREFKDVPYV